MKWLVFLLFSVPLFSYEIIEDKTELKIITPALAKRETARIRLDNGLEAFLISDPKTEYSGATLALAAGSFDEPLKSPGLAHFLEHMLFLGTKTYPEEAGFQRFVSEGGGITNAYTATNATCYIFSIKNESFEEGLDRFASFFKEPLFNPSGVSRELKAIDQEFAKNIENDSFRQHYIQKELCPPSHPFRQFSIGNSKTLSAITQAELREWFESTYSSDLMRVALLSPLPLNDLKNLAEKAFGAVLKLEKKEKDKLGSCFSYQGHLVAIEPVKEMRTLDLIFELPEPFINLKRSKPELALSYLLGHEGEGSLIEALREEHLAETLFCGAGPLGKDNLFFILEVGLTPQGLQNLNKVYERIFETLYLLKTEEIPPFLFEEMQQSERLNYQYQQKQPVFAELMTHAHLLTSEESLSTYPELSLVVSEIRPKEVKALLEVLTPHKARYEVKAPLNELNLISDRQEAWTGCPYTVQKIDEELLNRLSRVKKNPLIYFPSKNPYTPEDLSLVGEKESDEFPEPRLIVDTPFAKIFFAEDTHYFVPKVHLDFTIKTPRMATSDAEKAAMGDLFVKLLNESLQKLKSKANNANLNFEIERDLNGVHLSIDGLSDKASLLLRDILSHFKGEAPTPEKFQVHKESLLMDYQNFTKEPPLQQCVELLREAILSLTRRPMRKPARSKS